MVSISAQAVCGFFRFILPAIGLFALCCGPSDDEASKKFIPPQVSSSEAQPDASKIASPVGASSEVSTDRPNVDSSPNTIEQLSPPSPSSDPENPCEQERPVKLTLGKNVPKDSSFGIRVLYRGGGHKILMSPEGGRAGDLPFYEFTFRRQKRRADYRKTTDDWRQAENFQGICWRGLGKAKWHPRSVTIELAPMCSEENKLVLRGCRGAFRKKAK